MEGTTKKKRAYFERYISWRIMKCKVWGVKDCEVFMFNAPSMGEGGNGGGGQEPCWAWVLSKERLFGMRGLGGQPFPLRGRVHVCCDAIGGPNLRHPAKCEDLRSLGDSLACICWEFIIWWRVCPQQLLSANLLGSEPLAHSSAETVLRQQGPWKGSLSEC